MLKVLNNLRVDPELDQNTSPVYINDLSFDAPGHYPVQNRALELGRFIAQHSKRWPKGSEPAPPQRIVTEKIKRQPPPRGAYEKPDNTPVPPPPQASQPSVPAISTNPDQGLEGDAPNTPEKKRTAEFIESEPKHQKITPSPKPEKEPAPVVTLPQSPPPSPMPNPVDNADHDDDFPPDDDEPEAPPPTPQPRVVPTRSELLAGTGIDEAEYDSAQEPSDAIDLADSNGEDAENDDYADDGEGSEARPLPPVHLSYEERNAAEIAAVQAQHADSAPAKAKGKGKGKEKSKIEHIPATAENSPIAAGIISTGARKPKPQKLDKALLLQMVALEKVLSRISPNHLARKPQDLGSPDRGPNEEFAKLWDYAVDVALDTEFKRNVNREAAHRYGKKYEIKWLEIAKKVVYNPQTPEDNNATKIRNMHRLFWCYEKIEVILPEAPVDTSECWLVFKQPRSNQTMYTGPEVRVSFRYRRYESKLYTYKGLHPWEFLQGRATFMVKRIRQGQSVTPEKIEERLKNWGNNGVIRLMEWKNATIMGGWKFFT